MTKGLSVLAQALARAKAPVLFGLAGISAEGQHAAYRLARGLSAAVSVAPALLPTLTRASFPLHTLFLFAGGEPDFPLPKGATVLRDDRLTQTFAFRALSALQRGHDLPGAEEYRALHEKVEAHGGAALLVTLDALPEGYRDTLLAYRQNCPLEKGFDILQLSDTVNLVSAYATALVCAGGAAASFAGGRAVVSDAYALPSLLAAGGTDLALLIGRPVPGIDAVRAAGVPLYVLGPDEVGGAVQSVRTASFPKTEGGTEVFSDGLSCCRTAERESLYPPLLDCLETLLNEVNA